MIHLAAAVLVFLPMVFEAVRSRRNEKRQRARGGVEPPADVYNVMRVAYPASFLAMLAEGAVRGSNAPGFVVAGILVFAAAKLVKYSAILALGPQWTFRVIVVPGDRLVTTGPYRYLRHPNYVGVVGELIGIALLSQAIVSGPWAVAVFLVLLRKRIAVEERSLTKLGHLVIWSLGHWIGTLIS